LAEIPSSHSELLGRQADTSPKAAIWEKSTISSRIHGSKEYDLSKKRSQHSVFVLSVASGLLSGTTSSAPWKFIDNEVCTSSEYSKLKRPRENFLQIADYQERIFENAHGSY